MFRLKYTFRTGHIFLTIWIRRGRWFRRQISILNLFTASQDKRNVQLIVIVAHLDSLLFVNSGKGNPLSGWESDFLSVALFFPEENFVCVVLCGKGGNGCHCGTIRSCSVAEIAIDFGTRMRTLILCRRSSLRNIPGCSSIRRCSFMWETKSRL